MPHPILTHLKRYRGFGLAGLALAMNAGFWMAHRRAAPAANDPQRPPPVRFAAGPNGIVSERDRLQWTFDAPPALDLPVGEWHLNGPITLEPDVPGRFAWLDADRLVFEPSAEWTANTRFTATLPEPWTPEGPTPPFTFTSEPLRLLSVRKLAFDAERRATLRIEFNHPLVSHAELADHVSVTSPDGRNIGYVRQPAPDGATLILQTAPVAAERLRIDVARDLPAAQGTLGLAAHVRHTLVLGEAFTLQGAEALAPAFGAPRMTLWFNQPTAEILSPGAVTVAPEVPFSIERSVHGGGWGGPRRSSLILAGDFRPGETYAIRLHETLTDARGAPLQGSRDVTVTVPDRTPGLRFTGTGIYLSRRGAAEVVVQSTNLSTLDIALERLYANNLPYFVRRRDENRGDFFWPGTDRRAFSGLSRQVAAETRIPIGPRNAHVDTPIRIPELAGDHGGVFLLTVRSGQQSREQIVVLTDLALTARTAADGGLVWVTRLRDGTPAGNVRVRILCARHQTLATGVSDASGVFRWQSIASDGEPAPPALAMAETDNDMTFLSLSEGRLGLPDETGGDAYPTGPYEAWLFSERNLFRPGDRLKLVALVRDAALDPAPAMPVALRILGIDGKPWRTLNGMLDAWGAASFEADLPEHLRSGVYRAELLFPGQETVLGAMAFRIQSFLPPRLRVVLHPPETALRFPERAHFRVRAEYLHGGAAAGLPLQSMARFESLDFRPDGWEAYVFSDADRPFSPQRKALGEWRLDAHGEITLALPIDDLEMPPSMLKATLSATVRDFDGRATPAFAEVPVHRYPRYVGLKTLPGHAPVGLALPVETILVDPDGHRLPAHAPLDLTVERISRIFRMERDAEGNASYRSHETATITESRQLALVDGAGHALWTPDRPGAFRLTVADRAGGARASRRVRVTEGSDYEGQPDLEHAQRLRLWLDPAGTRHPGGQARLHVESPFPGWALISIEGPGLHAVRVRHMAQTAAVFEVPLPARPRAHGVFAAVTVVRALQPGALPLPARATGILRIPIDRPAARLALEWDLPAAPLRPGTRSDIAVRVQDADGQPAPGAQVWMLAVDEAIAALGNHPPPDPAAGFFRDARLDTRQADPFNLLLPEWEQGSLKRFEAAPGGDMPAPGLNRLNPFRARRYVPTAWWIGRVSADAEGRAAAPVEWPAFDGSLRLTAVAVHGQAFGAVTAPRICRHPIVLRSGLPRFLSCGDRADIRIDILNQDDRIQDVRLDLETRGPLETGRLELRMPPAGTETGRVLRFRIPPHGRQAVTVPVRAGALPGIVSWKLTAHANDETVVESLEWAVRPAAPLETRVQTVRLGPDERFEWRSATDWLPGAATGTLILSGSPAARLAPLLRGLLDYPYGCLEQTVSQAFPLLFIHDPSALLPEAVLTPEGVRTRIEMAVQRVLDMQRADGGFAYWSRSEPVFPWGSAYAVHFLALAMRGGYAVPSARLSAGVDYLYREVLDRGGALDHSVHAAIQRANAAYACRAVAAAGRPARNWMRTLRERAGRLDPASRLHLAAAYAEDGDRRTALAILEETPREAPEPTPAMLAAVLHSSLRLSALHAEAWRSQDPDHPRALAARQGLLDQLNRTRWLNTQEQAWSLMALADLAADAPAPVSLHIVQGDRIRTETLAPGETRRLTLDPPTLAPVTLRNTGARDAWFQTHISGYTRTAPDALAAADDTLRIRRTWLDRDGHPLAQPEAHTGDLLVVRLDLTAAAGSIDHLVIEDLLPAGLEPEESTQVIATLLPWVGKANTLPVRHVEIRDDRVLVFPQPVRGPHAWHYAVRAVTPGTFRAAPIAVESMYDGNIRARGPDAVFTVIDPP